MGSIQLGIKQSVGILGSSPGDLLPKDFEALETSRFTSEGGNNTLPSGRMLQWHSGAPFFFCQNLTPLQALSRPLWN